MMTHAEKILASRLLDMASEQYSNHGSNDADPECFEGLDPEEIDQLVAGFNQWWKDLRMLGPEDASISFRHIQDWEWMAYLAAVVARKDD